MKNILEIDGHKATISYDPDIEQFRGKFIGLNGGADFYSDSIAGLIREGRKSLQVFLDVCREKGIDPYKKYSGRFNLRINPELHEQLSIMAESQHTSLNSVITQAVKNYLENHVS